MRTLVLGAAGMLGHKLAQRFTERGHDVVGTIRGNLADSPLSTLPFVQKMRVVEGVDAAETSTLFDLLRREKPELILNCVGIIKQRPSAKDAVTSIQINALLPHQLADIATEWNGRMVHFSTDCVFSGKKGGYTLEDTPDAEDLYGRSKLLGEVAAPNALTLRTSIIGRELSHHHSLVDWFLGQRGQARGFTRAIYSGMTTLTMADLVLNLAECYPDLSGLYQAASEPISKYDLLLLVRDAFKLPIELIPYDDFECDRSFTGDRLREATGWIAPSWLEQIDRMATDPTPYPELKWTA